MADQTAIAHVPTGVPLYLMAGVGNVLDAALGGAMIAPSDGPTVAARIVLREDQDPRDAAQRLAQAEAALRGTEFVPVELPDAEHGLTAGRVREDPDGGLSVGINGPTSEEVAHHLLALLLPVLDREGATNYLEWRFEAPLYVDGEFVGPRRPAAIIGVRPDGKTPHELRAAAEARITAALAVCSTWANAMGDGGIVAEQVRAALEESPDD